MIWNFALSGAEMLNASGLLTSYLYSGKYNTYTYDWPYASTVPRPSYGWYSADYYSATQNILWDRSGHNNHGVASGLTFGSSRCGATGLRVRSPTSRGGRPDQHHHMARKKYSLLFHHLRTHEIRRWGH